MTLESRGHLTKSTGCMLHLVTARYRRLRELMRAAADLGFLRIDLDVAGVGDKETLQSLVAQSFRFPPELGTNWDALLDSLRDLSWLKAPGYMIVVRGGDRVARVCPELVERLFPILAQAQEDWRLERVPSM